MISSLLLDTGLPLLLGEWAALFCGLVFIIIESWTYNKFRNNLKKSVKEITIINIVSTISGVPLANAARYLLMTLAVYFMPNNIFPHKEEYAWETLSLGKLSILYLWEHFLLLAFILLINFVVTAFVKYWTLSLINKENARIALRRESFRFNAYSYLAITFFVVYQVYMNVLGL